MKTNRSRRSTKWPSFLALGEFQTLPFQHFTSHLTTDLIASVSPLLSGPYYAAARKQYISNFDLSDQRLDVAFRRLCNKLFLRAETQQVDRILEDFSKKYFEDNPGCVLPSSGKRPVHQISPRKSCADHII